MNGQARQRTDAERLEEIERLLRDVLLELRVRRARKANRAQRVARRAEAGVRIAVDEVTQRAAARILRRHASR